MKTSVSRFYQKHLADGVVRDAVLIAACPFCDGKGSGKIGKIHVFLNTSSFFFGYFRCSNSCVPGGFPSWFAQLAGVDEVPGGRDEPVVLQDVAYPAHTINAEIDDFNQKLSSESLPFFAEARVSQNVLDQLRVGYNGRYLVYPYFQPDGNAYSARCVHPAKNEDTFWYGDEAFAAGPTGLFNVEEIVRCAGGTLFLCEGEENLLMVKHLGFPAVAYPDRSVLEKLDGELFAALKTVFIVPRHAAESIASARLAASRIGFKVRILAWPARSPKNYSVRQLAIDSGEDFARRFGEMMVAASPFSPFVTPQQERRRFFAALTETAGEEYSALLSGFPLLDAHIGGIHGINIIGGGPKVGKSCLMIQIATEMALRQIPVLYYDFENGRQRIYQRTLGRMARIETARLQSDGLTDEERQRFDAAGRRFDKLLHFFRVINDRKVSPELMRRHIDFLRHETRKDFTVVVIDSLHKLPFKDLAEMRTGIDAWLRQMESIRDELGVSFLVISELSRGAGGSYDGEPHMGAFKGSGDIEYSADNAMVLLPQWDHMHSGMAERANRLWLVGSREHGPGLVANYILDYPYWGFREEKATFPLSRTAQACFSLAWPSRTYRQHQKQHAFPAEL